MVVTAQPIDDNRSPKYHTSSMKTCWNSNKDQEYPGERISASPRQETITEQSERPRLNYEMISLVVCAPYNRLASIGLALFN